MVREGRVTNGAVLLIALVLLNVLYTIDGQVSYKKARLQKLCSRKLSDALHIVCQERGYNEPYSNSNEDNTGVYRGVVEECCYHACTYEQLERYCKPLPEEEQSITEDENDLQTKLASQNLFATTLWEQPLQTSASKMDAVAGAVTKRKSDNLNARGRLMRKSDVAAGTADAEVGI